jgi:hypothetical protein
LKSSQIYHMVEFWRRTWKDIARSKSVSKLQSLYHRHFYHRDAKMNKRRYMARLNRGAQRTPWLSIKIRRFRILQNSPQQFTVRFLQYYRRPGLSDVGYKTLIWRKDGHYWRIYREYWKGR